MLAAPRATSLGQQSAAQADLEKRQQTAAFVLAADKAKDFYEKYPGHVNAVDARKVEVDSLFKAVRAGATEHEPRALRLSREIRSDTKIPSRDRFQVAMMVREVAIRQQNLGEARDEILAQYEKAAMDLYGEFPEEPAVFDLLIGVARNANADKSRALASQVLLMPAPPVAKEQARGIIARLDMPGKPLVAEWEDATGKPHQIQDFKGKIVVFYVWASWAPSPEADQKIKTMLPPAATLVSVNLDSDVTKGQAAKTKSGLGGISYFDQRGLDAPLARQLRADKVPGIYVVDAKGVFVGGGSPDQLAALLEAAAKP